MFWGMLALILLTMTACDELWADVGAEVKDAYGIDINNPTEIAISAFGAGAMGNSQVADGLDVYRAIRRVEHEENGDRLFASNRFAEARTEYLEALKWAPTGSDAQRNRAGGIYGQIANSYGAEADSVANPTGRMQLKRQEGRAWLQGARVTGSSSEKRSALILAGFAMGAGGDPATACQCFTQSGVDGSPAVAEGIKAFGCK